MKRPLAIFASLALAALLSPPTQAKTGVFSDMRPGDAVLMATKGASPIAVMSVRLDPVCETDEDGPLEYQMQDALAARAIAVDPKANLVLRYETAPCESDFNRKPNLAKQDAYSATSRAYELDPPARPFEFELGKKNRSGSRLTVNMLLFKPGQPPMWNALVAARAPGLETQDYLAQMAAFALGKLGEEGEVPFELVEAGGAP
ncbi:MAG: hypothetical protein AAF221_07015 [Pseudomonadota bacterium]